jgi:hypothetical protein
MQVAHENKALKELEALPPDFQNWLIADTEEKIAANAEARARVADLEAETKQAYKEAKAAELATVAFDRRGLGVVNEKTIEAQQVTTARYHDWKRAELRAIDLQTEARDLQLRLRQAKAGLPQAAETAKRACDRYGNVLLAASASARRASLAIRDAPRQDRTAGATGPGGRPPARLGRVVNRVLGRNAGDAEATREEGSDASDL